MKLNISINYHSLLNHIMMHTDRYYCRPTVYKMTTNFSDKLIQLDTFMLRCLQDDISAEKTLGNSYLKPVSFVSNDAAVYPDYLDDITINPPK